MTREKLFNKNLELISKLRDLGDIVQNDVPITEEMQSEYRRMYNEFYMILIDWDEELIRYLRWRIQEEKLNESNNLHN